MPTSLDYTRDNPTPCDAYIKHVSSCPNCLSILRGTIYEGFENSKQTGSPVTNALQSTIDRITSNNLYIMIALLVVIALLLLKL